MKIREGGNVTSLCYALPRHELVVFSSAFLAPFAVEEFTAKGAKKKNQFCPRLWYSTNPNVE
jgi:hypothetical protein